VTITGAALQSAGSLRKTLSRFATGVAVATTIRGDGTPAGVTINSFTSVGLDPPFVLWCLGRASSTLPAFAGNPVHVINILAADQESVARQFTSAGDRFAGIGLAGADPPVLAGTAAHLVCRVRETLDGGDHIIVLSEVLTHRTGTAPPLLFLDGHYRGVPKDPGRLGT
jgi:3-hydroxy-9,10-secoandrosta-1,3,5(10)-triene-9,17-dione monooxygenase reductase component